MDICENGGNFGPTNSNIFYYGPLGFTTSILREGAFLIGGRGGGLGWAGASEGRVISKYFTLGEG